MLDERIARTVGARPVGYERRPGGYSTADRFSVTLDDGRTVFVKSAEEPNLAGWIRREREVYEALDGSPFLPRLLAFDDDGLRPVLVLEDLSGAEWAWAWTPHRVDAVLHALDELAAAVPPPDTRDVRETFAELWGRWEIVANDPAPFLSTGLRDATWLERALPVILDAVARAPVAGSELCHLDVRSDNMCFAGARVVLVDWNWASLANTVADRAAWLPSLFVEGGPPPWEVLDGAGEIAAWIAGVWAAVVGTPPPVTAPDVRVLQERQLAVALDWLDRDLL
jgi:hypothetical protein